MKMVYTTKKEKKQKKRNRNRAIVTLYPGRDVLMPC